MDPTIHIFLKFNVTLWLINPIQTNLILHKNHLVPGSDVDASFGGNLSYRGMTG
jgi:hypothetical protein